MFEAILIAVLILSACVIGLAIDLCMTRRQLRVVDGYLATVRAAAECVARLNANVNQRAAAYRNGGRS